MRKPGSHTPSKKKPSKRPAKSKPAAAHPSRPAPKARKPSSSPAPTLTVSFVSIDVKHNGWPGEGVKATDLSLVLQLEDPDPAVSAENAALASAHLPFSASSGETVTVAQLPPDQNGNPFFGGAVKLSSHVNLHARLFVERTNAVGPILGAALNTVIGQFVGRIPLLAAPVREVLHVQIGRVIATELARATAIVPVDATFRGSHPVTLALVAPVTIPGLYAPPGSPEGYKKGVVSTEGDLTALLHVTLTLELPG